VEKLHDENLNDLYSPRNVIRLVNKKRMRWVRHVARMGERIGEYMILVGYLREREHLEDLREDVSMIFN